MFFGIVRPLLDTGVLEQDGRSITAQEFDNALIHRDYSDRMDEVTIFIYDDKIEITNSGMLPEKIVSGKTKVFPHGSVLRNPLMAEVFYIAGQMEKTGRGMALISNRMRVLGRRSPEWVCTNGKTTLRLFSQKEHLNSNERVLAFVKGSGRGVYFTKADYINFFEKQPSKVTAQNDLSLMLRLGLCERVGQGPSTKYKLV